MNSIRTSVARLALALLPFAAPCAHAACTVSTDPLAFGTYYAAQTTNLDAPFNFSIRCTGLFSTGRYTLGGNTGAGSTRSMTHGTDTLQYQIFSNSARTTVASTGTYLTSIFGETQTVTLYGRVFANQDVAPGGYVDNVTITITP